VSDILPLFTLVPGVPEFIESLVETDGESEGASEDASDKDAVSSGNGVIESVSEGHGCRWREGMSDVAGSRVSQLGPR